MSSPPDNRTPMSKGSIVSRVFLSGRAHDLRAIRFYQWYRLILAVALCFTFQLGFLDGLLGSLKPRWYDLTSISFLVFTLATFLTFSNEQLNARRKIIGAIVVGDIVCLLVLIHASGAFVHQLEFLLVTHIAVAAVFLPTLFAYGLSALCSFYFFYEASLKFLSDGDSVVSDFFSAGVLGIFLFTAALLFGSLAARIKSSGEIVEEKTAQLATLGQLAEFIMRQMRTGVVVVDQSATVLLINDSAKQFFHLQEGALTLGERLSELHPLDTIYDKWLAEPVNNQSQTHTVRAGQEVKVSFSNLKPDELYLQQASSLTVIYIEDNRRLAQQAQQLKLASLGRLTASIAHEIKNPLGALSHAAQLLEESEQLDLADRRLSDMVQHHAKRINTIVDTVSSLSRRSNSQPVLLDLVAWLKQNENDLSCQGKIDISFKWSAPKIQANIDPNHLMQILSNLCENGARYSKKATGRASVVVSVGQNAINHRPFIRVIDKGEGVKAENMSHLFEPFFTTDTGQGTGLGLYISQQLAEANQALLEYERQADGTSAFTLFLSHQKKLV